MTEHHHHDLMDLFEEISFTDKVKKVIRGLKQPKSSGEHKYAMLQLLRLTAPISAVVVPCIAMVLLTIFARMAPPERPPVEVTIIEPEAIEELDEIEELLEEPLEPPEPIDVEFTPDVTMANTENPTPAPPTDLSPQPAAFDSVAIVKSPVIMKGIYGSRSPGGRGAAIKEYGGSGVTEGAVLRALRWLKKNQQEDGSWPMQPSSMPALEETSNAPEAMTGLALLTFLAHGETPGSEEFGPTVEKAIRYLLESQNPNGRWKSSYSHAIAAYAMCEAYALTKIPMLRDAATRGVDVVIQGQNVSGGWNYPLTPCDRDDTSVMGWCAQALKAATMAGLENEGLENARKLAIRGFHKNADPNGGFGYATQANEAAPRATGLSGVGVLCLQLLGAARNADCRKGLMYLEAHNLFDWKDTTKWNQIYYWYYVTQAKFHAGSKIWREWNKSFAKQLVKGQVILRGEGEDGKDIGYWAAPGGTRGTVMDTTLCALQLQVYYRYLPTYRKPKEVEEEDVAGSDDIEVEITI